MNCRTWSMFPLVVQLHWKFYKFITFGNFSQKDRLLIEEKTCLERDFQGCLDRTGSLPSRSSRSKNWSSCRSAPDFILYFVNMTFNFSVKIKINKEFWPRPSDYPATGRQRERDRGWTPVKGHFEVLIHGSMLRVEIHANLCGMTSRCSPSSLWKRDKLPTTKMEDSSLGLRARRAVHVGGSPRHPGTLRGVQPPLLLLLLGRKKVLLLPKYSLSSRSRQAATNQSKVAAMHLHQVVFLLLLSITSFQERK